MSHDNKQEQLDARARMVAEDPGMAAIDDEHLRRSLRVKAACLLAVAAAAALAAMGLGYAASLSQGAPWIYLGLISSSGAATASCMLACFLSCRVAIASRTASYDWVAYQRQWDRARQPSTDA